MHSSEYNVFNLVTLKEQHQQRNSFLKRNLKLINQKDNMVVRSMEFLKLLQTILSPQRKNYGYKSLLKRLWKY